jgi:hypothetical protein
MVAERHREVGNFMIFLEPILEEALGHIRSAGIALLAPGVHCNPELIDQQQVAGPAT